MKNNPLVKCTALELNNESKKFLDKVITLSGLSSKEDQLKRLNFTPYVVLNANGGKLLSQMKERHGGVNTSLIGEDLTFLLTHYGELRDNKGNVYANGFHVNKKSFDGQIAPDGELVNDYITNELLTLIYTKKKPVPKDEDEASHLHWVWSPLSDPIAVSGKYYIRCHDNVKIKNGLYFVDRKKEPYKEGHEKEKKKKDPVQDILLIEQDRGKAKTVHDKPRPPIERIPERHIVYSADLNSAAISDGTGSFPVVVQNDNEHIYNIYDDNPTAMYAKDIVYAADLNSAFVLNGDGTYRVENFDNERIKDIRDDNPTRPFKEARTEEKRSSFLDNVIRKVNEEYRSDDNQMTYDERETEIERMNIERSKY